MLNPFSALTSKIFSGMSLALLMLLGLSHCSDKRHTAQRDKALARIVPGLPALGVPQLQCTMGQAARAAGCPVVLVRYGYNHGEPVDGVDADAHVDTLTHIAQALAGKA
mgnify:CR=1 FL=1